MEWARSLVRMRAPVTAPAAGLETLERRKLMLACMLARRPKVLLMDEPASGLTGAEIDEIDIIVRAASQEHGVAIVIVEHRLELLALVASRVIVLDVGKIIAEGPPETVFDEPEGARRLLRNRHGRHRRRDVAGDQGPVRGLRTAARAARPRHDARVGRARGPGRPERPRQVDPAAGDRRPHRLAVRLDPAGRQRDRRPPHARRRPHDAEDRPQGRRARTAGRRHLPGSDGAPEPRLRRLQRPRLARAPQAARAASSRSSRRSRSCSTSRSARCRAASAGWCRSAARSWATRASSWSTSRRSGWRRSSPAPSSRRSARSTSATAP